MINFQALNQVVADESVGFHHLKLLGGELSGLEENGLGNADLTHIVKDGGGGNELAVLLGEAIVILPLL